MSATPAYRRLPSAQRREEILMAATELIAVSGFDGVPLEAFATASGMTKAGLLHHFSSKENLLIAVLERRDLLDEAAAELTTSESAADPASARTLMTRVVRRNLTQRSLVQLYTVLAAEALDPTHPAHDYFHQRLQEARAVLTNRLLPWHPRPAMAAVELLAFLDGLQLNWLRDPEIDFLTQWETFADRFFGP
jgi:AcrR family transcriptional regulator